MMDGGGDGGTCYGDLDQMSTVQKKEGKINSMKTDTSIGEIDAMARLAGFVTFIFHAAVALDGRELDLRLSLFPLGRPASSACTPEALLAAMDALRWISSCACLVKKSSSAS